MEMLLMLTYAALCITVFKVFKLPLNKWTVPTAILGGFVLISFIMLVMNYNHPHSDATREYFVTTPIIPNVSGTVVSVEARPNVSLNKGEVLFTIDPVPFQASFDAINARLVSAEADLKRAKNLAVSGSISQRNVDQAQATYDNLFAQHINAEYSLAQTVVKAPTDGFITHAFLRPGMRAVAMPLRPVMVFVNRDAIYYTAFFRQNNLLRIAPGLEAEIAFDSIPGDVFTATVHSVVPVMREGQLQASGDMISLAQSPYPGRVPVLLEMTDPRFAEFSDRIPGGAFGQAAVYSEHAEHFAIIRRVLLRMASWMNYLFPFH
jgi:multidrug resistance efflux pump